MDTEEIHKRASNTLLEPHGIILTDADFQRFIGTNDHTFFSILKREHSLAPSVEELQRDRDAIILKDVESGIEPLPGARSLITELKGVNVRLAVASSSPSTRVPKVLDTLGLLDFFEVVITGDIISKPKPDPEIFLLAAEKMNVSPRTCVVFEDSQPGVEAAISAEMKCIAVPNIHTKEQDFSSATQVVDSLEMVDWRELFF